MRPATSLSRSPLRRGVRGLLLVLAIFSSTLTRAGAQGISTISLDGSLPNGRTDVIADGTPAPAGTLYSIDQSMGEIRGGNLFHSLLDFSIGSGHTAEFSALQPFDNVLVRVTGGNASVFNGTLRSTIMNSGAGGASMFVMNPAGILFGAGAQIDVPGNLYLTTAHALNFDDGMTLDLVDRADPVLTVANPIEFGFLGGAAAADIEFVNNDPTFLPMFLEMDPGTTLALSGGNLRMAGSTGILSLSAPSGRVGLAAVGSATATVGVDDLDLATTTPAELGDVRIDPITLMSGTNATAPDASQGEIVIRGGRFQVESSEVIFGGLASSPNLAIDVVVSDAIELRNGGAIGMINRGATAGGAGLMEADTISVDSGSVIETRNLNDGRGGDLELRARQVQIANGASVVTDVPNLSANPTGRGGDLTINAEVVEVIDGNITARANPQGAVGNLTIGRGRGIGSVRVVDGGRIQSQTGTSLTGGTISIATGQLEIMDGGVIESSTSGAGNSGEIDIKASSVELGRSSAAETAGLLVSTAEAGASGSSGNIVLEIDSLALRDGAQISTTTFGGDAGNISITADGDVLLQGDDGSNPSGLFARSESVATGASGSITVSAAQITLDAGAAIRTQALGSGPARDINLTAGRSIVVRGSGVDVSLISARGLSVDGGNITLDASEVELEGGGSVDSLSLGSGDGGSIFVTGGNLSLSGTNPDGSIPSQISARSRAIGSAGNIDIGLAGNLRISDAARVTTTSETGASSGDAGNVSIRAQNATLESGGAIESSAEGSGNAGTVTIELGNRLVMRNAAISTRSEAAAGGQLRISAGDRIDLEKSTITTSVASGAQNGGDLSLSAPFVILNDSNVIAQAFAGSGGAITIETNLLLVSATSTIDASSTLGIDGPIFQSVPNTDLSGQIAALTQQFLDAADELDTGCSQRTDRVGSFVVRTPVSGANLDEERIDWDGAAGAGPDGKASGQCAPR